MTRRLLLGCGAVGNTLAERTREERGELMAITDDDGWVSTLRDRNVAAVAADPTEPSAYPDAAAVVLVASDDPGRNAAAARAARDRFPDALVVAHLGTAPTAEQEAAIRRAADRVVDPVGAVVDRRGSTRSASTRLTPGRTTVGPTSRRVRPTDGTPSTSPIRPPPSPARRSVRPGW